MLDFKFEISDARKIAKTLVAFSNTVGGKLLVGVKDNGRIAGIRSEEEFYMIESAEAMYCKPPIDYKIKQWVIEGKTILEMDIPPGNDKPYYALSHQGKWLSYIRMQDQNLLVNGIQIRVWINQKRNAGIFLEYKNAEEILLRHLKENESINLSQFCKIAGINRNRASDILVKLASMQIISIIFTEKQTYYMLRERLR